jgi:hypothetical protein
MKRDEEIKKLLHYAKALGVKVTIRHYQKLEDMGEFGSEGPKMFININKKHHASKTELILSLLHELAHAKFFVLNNRPLSDGWILEHEREIKSRKLSKKLRKEMVDFELDSLDLMNNISTELNIQLPKWKILRQIEFDKWMYSYYLEHAEFATKTNWEPKWKELTKKYKGKK